jgi:hypothetical protein
MVLIAYLAWVMGMRDLGFVFGRAQSDSEGSFLVKPQARVGSKTSMNSDLMAVDSPN